ncbi:hypothetical protein Plim_2881 [Planctopirus limnophila DSM 3776]|uniref:Uncharacterized protein n=1 Tax=Planctopirus limnophila (strain ATCC 43296 / DSM 3776 / IFAM 1008 / Mu 290) TaxID=521674 RepID=D5SRX9_PLAL2|nr:hypothetical protein Plim_2881 [Planctopirus limnophila DSM 3776]
MTRVLTNSPDGDDFSEKTDSPAGLLATPAEKQLVSQREFPICDADRENEVNDHVNDRLNESSVNPLSHHGFAELGRRRSHDDKPPPCAFLRVPLLARQQCSSHHSLRITPHRSPHPTKTSSLILFLILRALRDLRGTLASSPLQLALHFVPCLQLWASMLFQPPTPKHQLPTTKKKQPPTTLTSRQGSSVFQPQSQPILDSHDQRSHLRPS